MGLFSNHKKPCPICGEPTPRLLATRVADVPICKACAGKIDLPDGALDKMSLEDFRGYLDFYDANKPLRERFRESYRYNFGLLSSDLIVDTEHGLFKLKCFDEALVFEADSIKSFRVMQDGSPLFTGAKDALRTYATDVQERVLRLQPMIDDYIYQMQEYERFERMERMRQERERADRRERGMNPPPPRYVPRPTFRAARPVDKFYVDIYFNHPYWGSFRAGVDGPSFNSGYPSADEYLNDYNEAVNGLYELSCAMMSIYSPNAQEITVGDAAAVPAATGTQQPVRETDAVDEIQKYKTLFDAGVITQEEFAAKKKQLLGI